VEVPILSRSIRDHGLDLDRWLPPESRPALSVAASRDKQGVVHVSIVNAHATAPVKLDCTLKDVAASQVAGRILTADQLDAHNTFDDPNTVKPTAFDGAKLDGDQLTAEIPPHSVVMLTLSK